FQTVRDSFRIVIGSLIKFSAILIANAFNLWRIKKQMIGCTANFTDAAACQPRDKFLFFDLDIENMLNFPTHVSQKLIKCFSLRYCPWETIEQETLIAIGFA